MANFLRCGIDALVVIGANGSRTGSNAVAATGFPVVGVASTIDNDLAGTDISIGVDTAVNITLEFIDRLRTTASSHKRAFFLIETMGRHWGYIAYGMLAGLRAARSRYTASRHSRETKSANNDLLNLARMVAQ